MSRDDLTGRVFGRLTVEGYSHTHTQRSGKRAAVWSCRCECGGTASVMTSNLKKGNTRSCGCLHKQQMTLHGKSSTRLYRVWQSMLQRCSNPNASRYAEYGGRGIKVCHRWQKFENFLADVGERPEGTSLDRINVNGDYEPGNVRWATIAEQARNKRANVMIEWGGRRMIQTDWAKELGIKDQTLIKRLKMWPLEKAMTTPRQGKHNARNSVG